ncbi:hypothetical protein B0H19DRAFT_1075641 [Mycena capillaripes]|nr:hypothetical protein B0H19DRAFT_1075641 [Mycena capillaripes]
MYKNSFTLAGTDFGVLSSNECQLIMLCSWIQFPQVRIIVRRKGSLLPVLFSLCYCYCPVRELLLSFECQEQGGMQADVPGQGAAWLEAHQIQNIFRVNGWASKKAANARYPIIALVLHPIPDSQESPMLQYSKLGPLRNIPLCIYYQFNFYEAFSPMSGQEKRARHTEFFNILSGGLQSTASHGILLKK